VPYVDHLRPDLEINAHVHSARHPREADRRCRSRIRFGGQAHALTIGYAGAGQLAIWIEAASGPFRPSATLTKTRCPSLKPVMPAR
jgi:hypothetical protein